VHLHLCDRDNKHCQQRQQPFATVDMLILIANKYFWGKNSALFLKGLLYTHYNTKRYHSQYYRRLVE